MRILHVPFSYYPDPAGGTEVYVASLARLQRARGWEAVIAAPAAADEAYIHDGLPVHRFRMSARPPILALYGDGDSEAAASFSALLVRIRPDMLHLHSLTPAVSIRLVKAA